MFRRNAGFAVTLMAGLWVVIPAATASAQGPCHVGNPSYCYAHPRPNIEVFCGRDRDFTPWGGSTHDFRGCRVRVGGAVVKCGTQSEHPDFRNSHFLTGCLVTFGVNRVMIGCEGASYNAGYAGVHDTQTCGVSPAASCTTDNGHYWDTEEMRTTCGPVVLHCLDRAETYMPGEHYCELAVGPAAAPIFYCRFDRSTPETTLADLLGCVTGAGTRGRAG